MKPMRPGKPGKSSNPNAKRPSRDAKPGFGQSSSPSPSFNPKAKGKGNPKSNPKADFKPRTKPEFHKDEPDEEEDALQLEGRNAVLEALKGEVGIDKILLKKGEIEGTLKVIAAKAKEKGIVVQEVERARLDELSKTGKHQGVLALCPAYPYATVEDMLANAKAKGEDPFIILLDSVTDPHNLGAIIRSAEGCGAHGVVIPKRRGVGLTAVAVRASAGAVAYVPVARVNNIGNVVDMLKHNGLWAAASNMEGQTMTKADLTGPLALVIGGEDTGVGRLIAEKCDFNVTIPMRGRMGSLNASVAAGVLMYEVIRQRSAKAQIKAQG